MGFTHLCVYTGCSARLGGSLPDVLAERAAERGLDALALTDRDTVAGVVRFAKARARTGVWSLFGVDLAVSEYLDPAAAAGERRRSPVRGAAFVDESAPADLEHAAGGDVYVLLGPVSEPVRAIASGRPDRAASLLQPWLDTSLWVGTRQRIELTPWRQVTVWWH